MGVIERSVFSVAPADHTDTVAPLEREGEGISLTELIQRARNASGEEREWLCTLVNRALCALGAATDKDHQATLLLQLLDDEALHGLEDARRVACRAVAVEALLNLGYPWALQLEPEDVQFLRDRPAAVGPRVPWARIAAGLAGLGSLAALGLSLVRAGASWFNELIGSPAELLMAGALGVIVVSAVCVVIGRPWSAQDAAQVSRAGLARFDQTMRVARWTLGISSMMSAAVVVANGTTYEPHPIHLFLLLVASAGAAGALLPRETQAR